MVRVHPVPFGGSNVINLAILAYFIIGLLISGILIGYAKQKNYEESVLPEILFGLLWPVSFLIVLGFWIGERLGKD